MAPKKFSQGHNGEEEEPPGSNQSVRHPPEAGPSSLPIPGRALMPRPFWQRLGRFGVAALGEGHGKGMTLPEAGRWVLEPQRKCFLAQV